MSEFDLIARLFAPLAKDAPGAFDLRDDAALLCDEHGRGLIISKDVLVEGVHFRRNDPWRQIAKKALRVNLSDLNAKGGAPVGYFLGCAWRRGVGEVAVEEFAKGLEEDQAQYDVPLLGGDTTTHEGPTVFSVTAIASAPACGMVRRSTAKVGDHLFVTGTIGDSGLGLLALEGAFKPGASEHYTYLADRYLSPQPPLAFGPAAAKHMSASIDVSDGLLADAGHIARESGVRLHVTANAIPVSPAAEAWLGTQTSRNGAIARLAAMGDDYQVLMSADPSEAAALRRIAEELEVRLTLIGAVEDGAGIVLVDDDGAEILISQAGYQHRL